MNTNKKSLINTNIKKNDQPDQTASKAPDTNDMTTWETIVQYIKIHNTTIGLVIAMLIYIITIITVFTKNPYDLITNSNSGVSIFLSLLGGFLMMMGYFFYQQRKQLYKNDSEITTLSFIGKLFTSLATIAVVMGFVYFLFTFTANFSGFTNVLIYGVNLFIFVGIIALTMKYFGMSEGEPKETKPSWGRLLIKTVTYLPCLFIELADYIKYQYQITTKPVVILLAMELILIAFYLIFPWIMNKILFHNANQLLKEPDTLTSEHYLGTFQKLNFKDDKFQYKYAVSSWIYIDSFPPETNPNYENFTTLLNIGNKPNIKYNVLKNELKIITQTQGKNEKILYTTNNFKMQRWNHIVINYDGNAMDIFINNELVATNPGTIPYNDNTQIIGGTPNGIHGGICNVVYYNENISRDKINWIYNSVKDLNPPVI